MSKKLSPWTVRSSKYILKDKWVNVRADDCVTVDGHEVSPYYVFELPDWAVIVAFDCEMNVLVIEQYRHGLLDTTYEFPGGIVDDDHKDPEQTVRRELLEETGCEVGELYHLASISPNPATYRNKAHLFVGFDCKEVKEPCFEPSEQIAHQFISLDNLNTIIESGGFQQGNHIGNLYLALRKAKNLGKLSV